MSKAAESTQVGSAVMADNAENETLAAEIEAKAKAAALAEKSEQAKVNSRLTLSSYSKAALIAQEYSVMASTDIQELQFQLGEQCKKVKGGNLGRTESMLISQAHSLDVIFAKLALDASTNLQSNMHMAEILLRLALKAQSQCRTTIETLAAIKNPPVVFARQANISHGHQQVNNDGAGSTTPARVRVREIKNKPNELLEHDNGKRLDTGAKGRAGRSNKAVATVEVVHRSENRSRQGKRKP